MASLDQSMATCSSCGKRVAIYPCGVASSCRAVVTLSMQFSSLSSIWSACFLCLASADDASVQARACQNDPCRPWTTRAR